MLPIPEKSRTAVDTGHAFDIAAASAIGEPSDCTTDGSDELSEFDRRIAATGVLLRSAAEGSVAAYCVARHWLGVAIGVILVWCQTYGGRGARVAQQWMRRAIAWSRVALPRFASSCTARIVTIGQISGHAIQRGAQWSVGTAGKGARAGWRGVSAAGRGGASATRRCVKRRPRPKANTHNRHPARTTGSPEIRPGVAAAQPQPMYNRAPARVSLRAAARDAWTREQEQSQRVKEEYRTARDAYEGAVLRQLMERRLGVQVFPRYPEVTVDGLRFALCRRPSAEAYELTLLTYCPGCGSIVASGDIMRLADLGSALDDVAAGRNRCEDCRGSSERLFVPTDQEEPDRVIDGPGIAFDRAQYSPVDGVYQSQPTMATRETNTVVPFIAGHEG